MTPPDSSAGRIGIPPFVAIRTNPWGRGGATFGTYLSALVDRPSLDDARVLCIGGTADMLHGLAEGAWAVGQCTAVEPDPVVAAFFWSSKPPQVDIVPKALDDVVADLRGQDPFDVVVVRTDAGQMSETHLNTTLEAAAAVSADDASLVLGVALAETTVRGLAAGDRLAERGELDGVDDYTEYQYELGSMPIYRRSHLEAIAAAHQWHLCEVREPHRSWHQHHVLLRRERPSSS